MSEIRSLKDIWGIHSKPQVPYSAYESALYKHDVNSGAKEALKYLIETRKLKLSTLQHFHVGYNVEQHEIAIPVIKDSELIDYKYRGVSEKTFRRHPGSATWIVNEEALQHATEDGYIIITEGELDALSVYQLGHRSVVSPTGGAQGPTPWAGKIADKVKVYINVDNDEPGQDFAQKLAISCCSTLYPT